MKKRMAKSFYNERKAQKAKEKENAKVNMKSITDIAAEARKAGMTYGKYVAKMGL
jgi:hypothetical protein